MKFSNGCWMNREGVTAFSPAKVYETQLTDHQATLFVPHNHIGHRGDTLTGPVFTIELSSPLINIIKVKITHFQGGLEQTPTFILHDDLKSGSVQKSDDQLTLTSGTLKATVDLDNDWNLKFSNASGFLTETGFRNIAYLKVAGEGVYMREQLQISVGETLYGLGERFTPFIKNGQTIDIWNEDGGTSTEQSYKNIPFYLSSKGYGVFVNHPEAVSFEMGSEKVTRAQFSVAGEALEYYIINGPTPKEVLTHYTTLTGKPGLPPAWSFGLWLTTSFTTEYDESTVNSFIDGMLDREIPLHTFHFDCFWMKAFNWCDFTWDPAVFNDPTTMLKRLKDKGLRICVWINPYIAQQSPLFKVGKEKGYFIKNPDGSVWQWDLWQPGMAIVDFTNPDASTWYSNQLEALMDMGVDSFKTDFGERIPVDVLYHDGSNPKRMHNFYPYLYNEVVYSLLERRLGKDQAVLFARSATVGSQKFPVHWGGDCTSEYESMAESLRGGLSLTLSGFGFWSHDIGGFESTSTPDVYKRWAAFGLLSTHSRLHGSSSYRVPWLYDEAAVDVVRHFSRLKCTLMPYIYTGAHDTVQSGVPLMKAMFLEFPEDPGVYHLDKQYMLGENLLVAPIFDPTGSVTYYLPKGRWTHLLSNQVLTGGMYHTEHHDYLSLPLMVRPNSVIPIGSNPQKPDYDYCDGLSFHAFELETTSNLSVSIMGVDNQTAATLKVNKNDGTIALAYDGQLGFTFILRGIHECTCTDASLEASELGIKIHVKPGIQSVVITL